jgi:flagellar biosynthesis GTPase FlhF
MWADQSHAARAITLVAATSMVLLSACGSKTRTTTVAPVSESAPRTTATTPSTIASSGGCTSGRSDAEIYVTIYGGGEAACTKWNQEAAKTAEQFWRLTRREPRGAPLCSMSHEDTTIEVRQGSLVSQGNGICARLTAKGWHEVEGPGERAEREKASIEAEQQAALERKAAAEHEQRAAREAQEHAKEAKEREAEEAARQHQEAQERKKEDEEHKQEAEKQHSEEAQQHQELERENRHTQEETHRAEQEARSN